MNKSMEENFSMLKKRVMDSLDNTDLELIRYELSKIDTPTITCGVGGSSVVSLFASKVLCKKNNIITNNYEPRDFLYDSYYLYNNVLSCSYSGNNYGVDLSFNNNLKHYLLSNNSYCKDVIYLKYNSSLPKEESFISLAASLMPISILLNYYLEGDNKFIEEIIKEKTYDFDTKAEAYEIFSGADTSVTAKYLDSTFTESGIGIPIIHDKYSYCHGRSTLSIDHDNIAIYLNSNKELDRLLMEELKQFYKDVIVIDSKYEDSIIYDLDMLVKAMYLTKYVAEKENKDLSDVNYCKICKKLYKYNKGL